MRLSRRKVGAVLLVIGMVILTIPGVFAFWYLWAGQDVFAAYSAKIMASGVFVAGRNSESLASQELAIFPFLRYDVDREKKTVTAWIFPGHRKTAVYREGLGVALAHDGDIEALQRQARPELTAHAGDHAVLPWPQGDAPSGKPRPAGFDEATLKAAVDRQFTRPSRFLKRHTRAVLVVYEDEIVAERYADGFDAEQRFAGWSMTKSLFHALCGIAVGQGKMDIHETVPFWQQPGDPRSEITLDMLLRMSSGLDYNEFDTIPPTALTTMLFLQPGAGDYALTLPLLHTPDTVWAYASASTNILSRTMRQAYGDDAYYALPYKELFSKLGMRSALIEADASGTLVGSSFSHATARDFARFGLLYLHDGVWQGERILPEGWVDYARTPTPTAVGGHYGAGWWLHHRPETEGDAETRRLPHDIFFASGFEGQFIVVIPSRNMVMVYLNLDISCGSPIAFIQDILEAFPETPRAL